MPNANHEQNFWIDADELVRLNGTALAPTVFDVRRPAAIEASGRTIAAAQWRDHSAVANWSDELDPAKDVVVSCVHGHNVSQSAAAMLRSRGLRARTLRDGMDGYIQAGGVTSAWRRELHGHSEPSCWVTREQPKIDRIACPWLIRRFIDAHARILYVGADYVIPIAEEFGGTPFDVDGVQYSHDDEQCSFDAFLRAFDIDDAALNHVARIVRGADTARLDLAPECAGLLALSLGVSNLHRSDLAAMQHGFTIYDALYAWARSARDETHNWPAVEVATGSCTQ
ncbi:MAG: rhodanese-related sulfurtransferase [Gammaproteobacteria bacterium]|jgi:rhodanese-related sulfurtransferase